jgi:Glutathione-dependent formaldehyde-activating enzyme
VTKPHEVSYLVGVEPSDGGAESIVTDLSRPMAQDAFGQEKTMKVTGGCHCGQITYEAEVDPATVRVCHCTDCQRLTGTAFRTNISSLPGTFVLKSGTPKIYIRQGWCRSALPWSMDLTGVERAERQ